MNDKLISAGIVTYNRKRLFEDCLNSLINQSLKPNAIYIFDNASTDGTSEFILNNFFNNNTNIAKHDDDNWIENIHEGILIFYKKIDENMGSSMGFYELAKKMFDDGYELIMITDDDVVFHYTYLEALINFIKKNNSKMTTSVMVNDFEKFEIKIPSPIFAGGVVSREVFEKVGLPVNDYFIYWDDVEFVIRAEKKGFRIETCYDAFCIHDQMRFSNGIIKKEIKFLGYRREFSNVNEWKIYYAYRNMIITLIRHNRYFHVLKKLFGSLIISFLLLVNGEKNKSILILWGIKDGILGRRGKNYSVFKYKGKTI